MAGPTSWAESGICLGTGRRQVLVAEAGEAAISYLLPSYRGRVADYVGAIIVRAEDHDAVFGGHDNRYSGQSRLAAILDNTSALSQGDHLTRPMPARSLVGGHRNL